MVGVIILQQHHLDLRDPLSQDPGSLEAMELDDYLDQRTKKIILLSNFASFQQVICKYTCGGNNIC